MAHLSVATVIEKNRIASNVAFVPLLEIHVLNPATNEVVEVIRYARNSEDITFESNVYLKGAFDLDMKQGAGEIGDVTVSIKDYTRAVQSRMQDYGGGVGFPVTITIVNTGNLAQAAEIQETYKVVAAKSKGYDVEFVLGAENPLTMRFPRRLQARNRCPWAYKGARCGYSGPLTTCDFSLQGPNGCAAHDNTERFGAFPGVRGTAQ